MITLVYPYYDNPRMFQVQQTHWNKLWQCRALKNQFEVVVVDDASPNHPARDYVVPQRFFPLRLFRIRENVRWNWIAAKNIGAHEAEGQWLCLTDMDHMWPESTLEMLVVLVRAGRVQPDWYYTFDRKDAPDLTDYKRHPNTYFMSRDLFWRLGGYDEEFSGYYGTDGYYRKRLNRVATGGGYLEGLYVVRYPREVIADASTTEFNRKTEYDKSKKGRMNEKLRSNRPMKALTFEYGEENLT